ncbi:chromate efflux transporter [Roseospira visakhapatnamensis]|uniref:Chromate transporter n=1 Tax=Roseospira visakhapatnamensis TaxID=390880 RepID=A0A7W6RDL0_9PROT|nr:chromate efflux transporter [Roseospira visakhapatnamensis]MBB4266543.1 chromate transporter [Roseospira visakhapatnamensis]
MPRPPVVDSVPAAAPPADAAPPPGADASAWSVFWVFLRLGLTSFGGPIAHLGYFRAELVERRKWLGDAAYADLVALCQFLPGPASSQVGLGLGLHRAGLPGALAAWIGFTLPSALLLAAAALGLAALDPAADAGWLRGLKIVAAAVVAQAVWGMARTLAPDRPRATLALGSAGLVLLAPLSGLPPVLGQIAAIALGAVVGWAVVRDAPVQAPGALTVRLGPRAALVCLGLLVVLLAGLPILATMTGATAVHLADGLSRAGALVFGGGHVVLPLLQAEVVPTGLVDRETFLAGYGLAQAVPGPLFTISAWLGASAGDGVAAGLALALLGTMAIFLPGALLLFAALPFWARLSANPAARAALAGVNAAVVGLLLAAFYDPVLTGAVTGPADVALGLAAFLALHIWKAPPWLVVLAAAGVGWAVGLG